MSIFRSARIGIALSLAAIGLTPTSAPAIDEPTPQPILLSSTTLPWVQGQQRWVTLTWTAQEDIEGLEVTVSGDRDGVDVAYEDAATGHARLSGDDDLSANEVDITSFFVDPGPQPRDEFELDITVEWWHEGEFQTGTLVLHAQQESVGTEPFVMLTKSAQVPAGGDGARNWVELGFLGLVDDIRDFNVSIEGDLAVYYPQRSFTSLHHDAVLLADERDVARFWLDPSTIEPGSYALDVVVSYTIGDGPPQESRSPLQIQVG